MRGLVVFALVTGCRASEGFACQSDDDCAGADGGRCEPIGFCSFPDEDCGSGRRYGRWAGDELASSCVPDEIASGSTTDTGDGDTLVTLTSSDPTTLTTSATVTATSNTSADTGETTSPIDPGTSTSMDPTTGDDATTGEPSDPDLVAWYRFEEDDFTDAVVDELGMHDGTCTLGACPMSIDGIVGHAAAFDGMDDVVHIAASDALQVDAELTIALWVRIATADASYHTFAGKAYLDQTNNTWELGLDSRGSVEFGVATLDAFVIVPSAAPAFDTWAHLAGTFDGEVIRLYLDGVLIGEAPATDIVQDEHGITLGADNDLGLDDGFFDGALDEVRIYRRALAEDEVAALASAP
jgi:hypothetical protein